MKKLCALLFILWQQNISAQTPSVNKMRQSVRQAQQSVGIRPEEIPGVDAANGTNTKMPVKDIKRIATISDRIFSYAELCDYIKQVHTAVEKKMQLDNLSDLNNFYTLLRTDTLHKNMADNAASGCMLMGYTNAAIWLMGKASIDNPTNSNILNNYAAFLIMNGGEHLALPILNRLNYFYPGNITVLNNLGQAWFGLGDLSKANKYLDTAKILFPGHAQAGNTKSYIEESKGNKEEAVKQAKESIQAVYSREKENHIKKMGQKLSDEDITWNQYMPEDAVGFDKILAQRPEFYMNRDELISLEPAWQGFIDACNDLSEKLSNSLAGFDITKSLKQQAQLVKNDRTIVNSAFWVAKARTKLQIENADYQQHALKWVLKKQAIDKAIYAEQAVFQNSVAAIYDKYAKMPPAYDNETEMQKRLIAQKKEICQVEKPYAAKLFAINAELREACMDWTGREKRFRKNSIYYNKFILPTQALIDHQTATDELGFINTMQNLAPIGFHPALLNEAVILSYDFAECTEPDPREKIIKELPDFDAVNCKTKSEFVVPRIGKITLECNIMTTELDDRFPIHGSYTENWVKDKFIKGTIGIGGDLGIVDVGVDINFNDKGFTNGTVKVEKDINIVKAVAGPLQVGVKGTVGVTIGFGSDGIEDVTLTGAVKGNINASGGDKDNLVGKELNVKTGATESMVWNAGGFSDSKGKFSGLSIAGFK